MGRPILYGLAAGDEEGVKTVITEVAEELKRTIIMTGVKDAIVLRKRLFYNLIPQGKSYIIGINKDI